MITIIIVLPYGTVRHLQSNVSNVILHCYSIDKGKGEGLETPETGAFLSEIWPNT